LNRDTFEAGKRAPLTRFQNPALWTEEEWKLLRTLLSKAVSQFDLNGIYIKTYKSIREAAKSISIKSLR
jgi:hypothetical protein